MVATVTELLRQKGIRIEDTLYGLNSRELNEFPITAGDFFRMEPEKRWRGGSWLWEACAAKCREKEENPTFLELKKESRRLGKQIRELKETDPKGYGHMEELRALRTVNQGIREAMRRLVMYYRSQILYELEQEMGIRDSRVLAYKNTVSLGSFADLERQAEAFCQVGLPWLRKTPLLLGNIPAVTEAVRKGMPIGIVGGPCLFGTHEVEVLVRRRDGSEASFDFSSGRRYDRQGGGQELADYLEDHAGSITGIAFCDNKKGVTVQEQESLEVLFAMASPLGARVAIPVPDISYLKYLYTIGLALPEKLRDQSVEDFRKITRRIADLYLTQIERLKRKYPGIEVQVLHERNQELVGLFYERREEFFSKSGLIRRLTAKRAKTDAIFDYISMLALPYYIWETPCVIQVDNLDETDSYRKCRKVHKNAFALASVLYPEKLSRDGVNTIFNAPIEYKDYIDSPGDAGCGCGLGEAEEG